ncbi:hypothetical protein AMECASPLE_010718 [Ameca splendens]|uniref:Uncharacterized protein n=1 Tax=Ameca splendens TaxID=208324 RepID=A0ABV0XPI1_9TELE
MGELGPQSIAGQHRDIQDKQPCKQKGNFRKPEYPRENPRMHGKNMQTPCRKTPGRESNPGSSCCKATVLPTVPPYSPKYLYLIYAKIFLCDKCQNNDTYRNFK